RGGRDASAAGHHHYRRSGGQPIADPVHHTRHLSIPGALAPARAAAPGATGRLNESIAMKILPLSITLLAVLLSACTVGPDYIQPETVDTATIRHQEGWQPMPAQSWAASGNWWLAFEDDTLTALVERSTQANQTLAQAEARFRAAEAQWRLARGGLSPEVGATVGGSRSGGSGDTGR